MIATIHVRMTMILHPEGYTRWLSDFGARSARPAETVSVRSDDDVADLHEGELSAQ